MRKIVCAAVPMLVACLAAVPAEGQTMKLGEVLVFAPSGSRRPADPQTHLLQADRGNRKGQHLLVWVGSRADPLPPSLPGATGLTSEYRLLAPAAVGPLPDVDVLGVHYTKVRPDRREAFEKFVASTVHPAVANLRPDLRLLYYKAASGADAGNYLLIIALTKVSRDKYWPGGADSDELRAAFKPVQPLTTELITYFVEGSALTDPKFAAAVFEAREWTDFVLVTGAK